MTQIKCIVSSTLLTGGILLVFGGLSQALGFTAGGMLASAALITTLLYAGGVWFRPLPSRTGLDQVVVFDRTLRVSCGGSSGTHIASLFPPSMRAEIEARCAAALAGQAAHFTCDQNGETVGFDAAPVRAADGTIVYGMLITGTAARPSAVAACIAS